MSAQTDSLTLRIAATIPLDRLTHLLNRAYADYAVPIWFSTDQFEQMCDDMDVDLTQSVIAMVDEEPVGVALLSLREREGWVSGVGVIPAWRRQGVGRAMITRIQAIARELRLDQIRLEVLKANAGGRRLYEEMGFAWVRDLLVLRTDPMPALRPNRPLRLIPSDPLTLLRYQPTYQTVSPSWQRALPSLRKRADRFQGLGVWLDHRDAPSGYVLYQAQPDVCHILDLVVDPQHAACVALARQILLTLHGMYPDLGGYTINVPADDPLLTAYIDIGYKVWHRQGEMTWPVRPSRDPHEV